MSLEFLSGSIDDSFDYRTTTLEEHIEQDEDTFASFEFRNMGR